MDDASISIPNFKVIINILDLPPHLYREKAVQRATSGMGLYLGNIAQADPTDLTTWTAVIATDNLKRISSVITMSMGGMTWYMPVRVIKVETGPLYSPQDLPTQPPRFKKPIPTRQQDTSSDDDEEEFTCSLRFLHDLCKNRDPATIPAEVQAMLAGTRRPRFCLDDLTTFLMLHKDRMATEDPGDSGPPGFTTRATPVGVVDVSLGETGQHIEFQTERPPRILHRDHSPRLLENYSRYLTDDTRVETSQSHALPAANPKTRTRPRVASRDKGKQEAKDGVDSVKPAQMKKTGKRVELKTRYGTLHRKPHGKGVQIPGVQPKKKKIRSKELSLQGMDSCRHQNEGAHSNIPMENLGCQRNTRNRANLDDAGGCSQGRAKPGPSNNQDQSPINLDRTPDGFYKVHVAFQNIAVLAKGCGVSVSNIEDTIQ